jgi:hypothetical protein
MFFVLGITPPVLFPHPAVPRLTFCTLDPEGAEFFLAMGFVKVTIQGFRTFFFTTGCRKPTHKRANLFRFHVRTPL